MDFRNIRAYSLLKRALILAIVASNFYFTEPSAMAAFPDTPSNISVTAGDRFVDITWEAPNSDGVYSIIGYKVRNQGGELECVTTNLSCRVNELTNGTSYLFFITAQNTSIDPITGSGRESFPALINATPMTTPQPPNGVNAVGGNGSATITWNPVQGINNGGSDIISYVVSSVDGSVSCETVDTVCTLTGLTNGSPYQFTVVAINAVGPSGPSGFSNTVTPIEPNFDSPESLLNYLSAHPQSRALPSGYSLYDIRCSLETNLLELGIIHTQTANFTLTREIILPEPNTSCDIQTAYGPSGLYMTISDQGEASLYKVEMSTGNASKIDLSSLEPSGLQPNQITTFYNFAQDSNTGALYYIFRVADSIDSLPLLYLYVLTPSQDGTSVSITSQSLIGGWSSPTNPDNSGNTLVPLFDWEFSIPVDLENGQIARVFADIAGLIDNGPVIGVVNQDGTIVPDAFEIIGPGGLPQSVGLMRLDSMTNGEITSFADLSPFIDQIDFSKLSLYLKTLILSPGSLSFNPSNSKLYTIPTSMAGGGAEIYTLDSSIPSLTVSGEFLAATSNFYGPVSNEDGPGANPFGSTTIDSNGTMWNIYSGILQTQTINGWSVLGDFESTGKLNFVDMQMPLDTAHAYTDSIFIAQSSAATAGTPTVITPPILSNAAPSAPINTAPSAPTSVVAKTTSKRSATVSFAPSASNGGSVIISYTAISSPGGITKTLTQSSGGTFTFENLQPGTTYTFALTATNEIGTSVAAISNSIKTIPLEVASISSLSFVDDGTGTGGKIVWSGNSIDSVLYTGPINSYPGPHNYGAFTSSWNGRIRNLTPDTSYEISIFAISSDGVGETKNLTFKTSATLSTLSGVADSTVTPLSMTKASQLIRWVEENTFVPGEATNMSNLLLKFDALEISPHRAHIKVPTSRVSKVDVKSLTPEACSVVSPSAKVDAGLVTALSGDKCSISYTVTGASKAPATLVKDFFFKKYVK